MPNEWPPRHLAYGAGAAMTLYGLAAAQSIGRLHVPRLLVAIGAASYSLYLIHVIVILFLQQALLLLRPHIVLTAEVWFVIFVGVSIAAGLAFARIVEQPLMRRLRARRAAPAPATGSV